MPNGKRTQGRADSNDGGDEATVAHAFADGLSVHRQRRPRHDEVLAPRSYKFQPDDWPAWQPPPGSRKPTDEDKAVAHALIHAVQSAIGEADDWKPGPNDTIMNDETRARLEKAYEAFTGGTTYLAHYIDSATMREKHFAQCLANLLRLREQARVYGRVRSHKGKFDANGEPDTPRANGWCDADGKVMVHPIATTGAEIAEHLRRMNAAMRKLGNSAPPFDDDAPGRLASLIDQALAEGTVNLGGAGGRGGGRTPEQWAHSLVLALKDPVAYRADCERRRLRTGRHKAEAEDNSDPGTPDDGDNE